MKKRFLFELGIFLCILFLEEFGINAAFMLSLAKVKAQTICGTFPSVAK